MSRRGFTVVERGGRTPAVLNRTCCPLELAPQHPRATAVLPQSAGVRPGKEDAGFTARCPPAVVKTHRSCRCRRAPGAIAPPSALPRGDAGGGVRVSPSCRPGDHFRRRIGRKPSPESSPTQPGENPSGACSSPHVSAEERQEGMRRPLQRGDGAVSRSRVKPYVKSVDRMNLPYF